MLKTLEEINKSYIAGLKLQDRSGTEQRGSRRGRQHSGTPATRVASEILFYTAVLIIFFTIVTAESGNGVPRSVFGFSSFVVMSSSMEDEMPKGSLIIIRDLPAESLKIGDNITFSRGGDVTVTHKIIAIIDVEDIADSSGTAQRRFQTKGTNNEYADNYTVAEADVLGKVVLILPGAGSLLEGVTANIHILLIFFLLLSILSFLLRGVTAGKQGKSERFGVV